MSCQHHRHADWLDKFQEILQCCQEKLEEGDFSYLKDPACGNKVSSRVSFTPPVHKYVEQND